ncbi:hypothetical protein [Yunchengibacter salinarum]|uniref:hypothetical protein n=1 Tax=Yunchengibacter salinarum TaxID=3133399 RepID=UPI0035B6141F
MTALRWAIATVSFVGTGPPAMLTLQRRFIEATAPGPDMPVYCAIPRLTQAEKVRLAHWPRAVLMAEGAETRNPNREHGLLLDRLVARAFAEGADRVLTLDTDSFPIVPDWAERLSGAAPFTAILRRENGDTVLPHPSGCVITRRFFEDAGPTFWPDEATTRSDAYANWLSQVGQRPDTGIGYAHAAHRAGLRWQPLYRSNRRNVHPLVGGLYGDVLFHLGAMSRRPLFHADGRHWPLSVTRHLARVPVLWRLHHLALSLRARYNRRVAHTLLADLLSDPAGTLIRLGAPSHVPAILPVSDDQPPT